MSGADKSREAMDDEASEKSLASEPYLSLRPYRFAVTEGSSPNMLR
jgi:hypothetical protein